MKRRELLLAAAGLAAGAQAVSCAQSGAAKSDGRQYLELRKYYLANRAAASRFNTFLEKAALPALNRIGANPVGVFTVTYGENMPGLTVFMLLPYDNLEAWASAKYRLAADEGFNRDGADVLDTPLSNPAYLRVDTSLLHCFKGMPTLEVPPQKKEGKARLFELRIYESHCVKPALRKIEMFNEGGEIEIFRKTGLNPVFFGETLAGVQMPNLHYMLCHDDMAARDAGWDRFGKDPGWIALREVEKYKDTVSNITDVILRPADFSQV
ncbi:MAG TPA: NIPSNAP family protein [Candidatus Glassbacteria bacterium]|nr:NIPSNAP family protein [Candidatus Glassbacteria bacterium]